MLQKAYLVAKIGADTAENEQHFAQILPIGRRVADRQNPQMGSKLDSDELMTRKGNQIYPSMKDTGHSAP